MEVEVNKGRVRGPERGELELNTQSFRAGKSHNCLERKPFRAAEKLSNEPYKCPLKKYSCWSQAFDAAYMFMALVLLMTVYDRLFYNVYWLDQISEYPSEIREELSIGSW